MIKIIIIGDAGRGKTTLANNLSKKLGIKHYSTDDFYYEVKFTKPRNKEYALGEIRKIYKEDKWIVEGTTQWLLADGMDSSDVIIYLKYKNIFSQWWILFKRHFKRKDESFKNTLYLMRHVFYKKYGLSYKKGKPTHIDILAPYKNKVIILTSFKDINNFVDNIK
ncbi:MAG: hypothetical protein HQ402_02295 [Parcubacteria group bacterium]|nr:hypothetical protein [Parcubacteria group bacterium]